MARKSKKFQYDGEGAATVYVPGHSTYQFEPGKARTVETDDDAVIAALEANPDVSEVKESRKPSSGSSSGGSKSSKRD